MWLVFSARPLHSLPLRHQKDTVGEMHAGGGRCGFPSPPYSFLPNLPRLQTTYPASCVKCTCWNLWGYFGPGYARVRTRPSCDGKSTAASRIATIDCHIDGVCIHWMRHMLTVQVIGRSHSPLWKYQGMVALVPCCRLAFSFWCRLTFGTSELVGDQAEEIVQWKRRGGVHDLKVSWFGKVFGHFNWMAWWKLEMVVWVWSLALWDCSRWNEELKGPACRDRDVLERCLEHHGTSQLK